jgi:hypothetical protein
VYTPRPNEDSHQPGWMILPEAPSADFVQHWRTPHGTKACDPHSAWRYGGRVVPYAGGSIQYACSNCLTAVIEARRVLGG